MNPEITIVFLTWPNHPARWAYFMNCVPRVLSMVTASEHTLLYKCASESDQDPSQTWYGHELEEFCKKNEIPLHYRGTPANLGAAMNFAADVSQTKYTMIVQDDWFLHEPFNLSPGINLMEENPEIDTIRYSWPEGRVTVVGEFKGWKRLDPNGSWPYGDDPHIRRDNFFTRFGRYYDGGPHGISEGTMGIEMGKAKAFILLSDKLYFAHSGGVTAVINDLREVNIPR